ncbi:hypothetical protein JCM18899A_09380 [Nocardioides sp. AN3]
MSDQPIVLTKDVKWARDAMSAYMDRFLDGSGFTFTEWYAVNILARSGPTARSTMAADMSTSLRIAKSEALTLLDDLVLRGALKAVTGAPETLELTTQSEAIYAPLREWAIGMHPRVYEDISEEEIAITHRVLTLLTARFEHEYVNVQQLAQSSGSAG